MNAPLSAMILQPDSINIRNEKDCQRMTEVWKGPWSQILQLTDLKNKDVFGAKIYPGIVRPEVLDTGSGWKKEFTTPKASISAADVKWIIENVEARQIEAGDYGLLTIEYSSIRENTSSGGTTPNPDVPADAILTEPTTWTLTWSTFTRSPIEYATDTFNASAAEIKMCYENGHPGTVKEATRYRQDITSGNLKYAYYVGVEGIDRELELLPEEQGNGPKARVIYDYMCNGITPQFHAPVVTKQDFFQISAGVTLTIAGADTNLDKIVDLPGDCPYAFADYEWIKVDNSYQVTLNTFEGTKYTRTQTWKGAKKWDPNFYGPNAWELPDVNQGN